MILQPSIDDGPFGRRPNNCCLRTPVQLLQHLIVIDVFKVQCVVEDRKTRIQKQANLRQSHYLQDFVSSLCRIRIKHKLGLRAQHFNEALFWAINAGVEQ